MFSLRSPFSATIEQSVVSLLNGQKYRAISMQCSPHDLNGTVEVSSNLLDWYSGSKHTSVLTDTPGYLKVRDNTPFTSEKNRFIRFKVTSD